jgi:hypothetical protein
VAARKQSAHAVHHLSPAKHIGGCHAPEVVKAA